jgi:putative transposase
MPYWQLYYHIVWATKNREPLLTPEIEPRVHEFLRNKALNLEARVYALNGYLDHVHLVVSIPPKIAVAKFIGQVKAVASVRFNQSGAQSVPFYWQEEYGVFSFDRKRLPNFIGYVERQKDHHTRGTVIPVLERDFQEQAIKEEAAIYHALDDVGWVRELNDYDPVPADQSSGNKVMSDECS